jgi:hypothetical protein
MLRNTVIFLFFLASKKDTFPVKIHNSTFSEFQFKFFLKLNHNNLFQPRFLNPYSTVLYPSPII